MDGTLPWGSIPMDPVPPNYEIEYVEEPIQKEEFVPQLNVPLQQEMVTNTGLRVSKRYKIISDLLPGKSLLIGEFQNDFLYLFEECPSLIYFDQ